MILIFIKYFTLFLSSLYTSNKITNKKTHYLSMILCSLVMSCITSCMSLITSQYYLLPSCFIYYFCVCYSLKNIKTSVILALASYAIPYCLFTILRFLFSFILYMLKEYIHISFASLLIIFASTFTPFLTYKLLNVKRLKSGMPFLFSLGSANLGLLISLCIIGICVYSHHISSKLFYSSALIQLLACLLLIPFIAWLRSHLTKSYRQYLKDAETQELRAKVEQLTADNQRLSQIVHKDNKLITAMTSSVLTFVEEIPDYSPEHLSAYSRTLHQELLSLSTHRQDSLSRLSGTVTGQFHTGHMMLDSVLNLQAKQAREYNITFSAESNKDFFAKIFSTIDEEQLTHIVADLVQNAIIATKDAPYKSVDISFVTGPQVPSIQISDTGLPFPTIVLNNLGQERCSQHLQDGGSGIGLMDIWALKSTAKATLLIEEFPDGAKFTKRIHLIFDNKNRYLIMSDRKDELSSQLHRPDVILLSSSH